MQKYVSDEIYVAIENGVINLDDAAIAEFYKTFDGYHYTVMDTMWNIVTDVGEAFFDIILCALVFNARPDLADSIIVNVNKPQVTKKEISQ